MCDYIVKEELWKAGKCQKNGKECSKLCWAPHVEKRNGKFVQIGWLTVCYHKLGILMCKSDRALEDRPADDELWIGIRGKKKPPNKRPATRKIKRRTVAMKRPTRRKIKMQRVKKYTKKKGLGRKRK